MRLIYDEKLDKIIKQYRQEGRDTALIDSVIQLYRVLNSGQLDSDNISLPASSSSNDGWVNVSEKVTCGTNNILTFSTGGYAKFAALGDKIYGKDDGTVFYGFVTSISAADITIKAADSSGTVVTVASGSVITEVKFSKQNAYGFPKRMIYTPQFYQNNGTSTLSSSNHSSFYMYGPIVYGWVEYSGLGNPVGGNYFFTPPIVSSTTRNVGCGAGIGVDGVTSVGAMLYYDATKDKIGIQKPAGGNWYASGAGAGFVNFNYWI